MKKFLGMFFLLMLAGCLDLTQYISFDDEGKTVSSFRVSFPLALGEQSTEQVGAILEQVDQLTNLSGQAEDTNITTAVSIFRDSVKSYIENTSTASKNYFSQKPILFFPKKESYGFSLPVGDTFSKSMETNKGQIAMASIMISYRILLPVQDGKITSVKAGAQEAHIQRYGPMYVIEIPVEPLLQGISNIEFHKQP